MVGKYRQALFSKIIVIKKSNQWGIASLPQETELPFLQFSRTVMQIPRRLFCLANKQEKDLSPNNFISVSQYSYHLSAKMFESLVHKSVIRHKPMGA